MFLHNVHLGISEWFVMNIQMFMESNGNKLVEHNSLTQVYKAICCVVMYKKNYPIQPCRELHVCVWHKC